MTKQGEQIYEIILRKLDEYGCLNVPSSSGDLSKLASTMQKAIWEALNTLKFQ